MPKRAAGLSAHDAAEAALRAQGLAYPETTEEFPWGHRTLKVRGKAFAFMGREEGFSFSVKLPSSCHVALDLPFAEPTGYGLGGSGWVTARFAPGARVPLDILALWLEESYRAVAPKRVAARLDAPADPLKADPPKAKPPKAKPPKTEPVKAKPVKAKPMKAKSAKKPVKANPARKPRPKRRP
jgi:predicted DNA-binding protein (MmcQ/YjbR family)